MARRWSAASLVLVALPAGLVAGLLDTRRTGAWITAAVVSASALIVIATSRRPGAAAPQWRALAGGMALWAGAMVAAVRASGSGLAETPLPTASDLPRLAGLALIGAALLSLARKRTDRTDWAARLDAAMVGLGLAAAAALWLWPELRSADVPVRGDIVVVASIMVWAVVMAAAVSLGLSGTSKVVSGRFVMFGVSCLTAGATLLRAAQVSPGHPWLERAGAGLSAGASLVLAGAALHPSAARLTERASVRVHEVSRTRLLLITMAATAVPVTAVSQHLQGQRVDGALVGLSAIVILALAGLRLHLVARAGQSQAERSGALTEAARGLAEARSEDDVRAAALTTARAVLGADLRYVAWVAVNDRGATSPIEVVGPDGPTDRASSGLDTVLGHLAPFTRGPLTARRVADGTGRPVVVAPVSSRHAGRFLLIAASARAAPPELDQALVLLGQHAALALDSLFQADRLRARHREALHGQLVAHASDAILIVGRDGRIRYQSPSVPRVLGYLSIDLDGAPLDKIVHSEVSGHVHQFLDQLAHGPPETVRIADAQMVRADDSMIHVELVGVQLLDNPDVGGIVLTIRDVTGRRTLEDQLRHQAFHDSLTGLANRALFLDRVEHALARVRVAASPLPAVAFVDLDDFKVVNDTLGHGAGDELLCAVADRLRSCLRSGDTPARLGGDEFAVLLEDAPDMHAVIEVAERILEALRHPIQIDGREVHARASIGIAARRGTDTTPDELLRQADLAMYSAKAAGKGRIEVFEPAMRDRSLDRLAISGALERSVERGEIDVAFQPIVRLDTLELVGFESLARWAHPERGPVSPAEFVPIAEDSGIIVPLGRHVLRRACHQLAAWSLNNPEAGWTMSVNLSARQLLAPDLLSLLRQVTTEAGITPQSLVLELTEAVLLSDSERVLTRLHTLKDLGVKIAIDDFGTGFSSLSYLQRVPFDIIKIDRAFVAALRHEDPALTLVRTIVDLARGLGRVTVAEGVEEAVELEGLLTLGCDLGQGHLLGAPLDAVTLERELELSAPA